MVKKYWVDADGYIIYGNNENQVIVCEMYPEHVQALTRIIESYDDDLLDAAKEILSDFNRYGEVLQRGDNGEYGTESAIGRLSAAIHRIKK